MKDTIEYMFFIVQIETSKKKDNSCVDTGVKYGVASFSSWSKSIRNPEISITRIKGSLTTTASFKDEHFDMHDKSTSTYLPQIQARRFPPSWLTIFGLLEYSRYAWVHHIWSGALKIKVLGRSPIQVTLQHVANG